MNIACVHSGLVRALCGLGHQVLDLRPPPGIVRVVPLLEGFRPDLFIQQETLGPRTLVADLPALDCPRVFWSVDTHQNSFWHEPYARLFDLLCTTQKHWARWFADRGVESVMWLPWHGLRRAGAPWEGRRFMGFAGRLSPQRPVRSWFVDWLRRLGEIEVRQDLGFSDMLDFYEASRLAPNESIFGEVNFRLFEAASCGCAVLNPLVPGLEDLFAPGEEVAAYREGAELAYWVRRLGRDDVLARSMGLRARERVLREHLPVHRAGSLLDAVRDLPRRAAGGEAAVALWWRTLFQLREAGRLELSRAETARGLSTAPVTPEVLAALLRLEAEAGPEDFRRLALPVIETEQYAASRDVNLAGSMGALRHDDPGLARLFFLRHRRHAAPGAPDPGLAPLSICLAWAGELQRTGPASRPGFTFNPGRHLPASAVECLVLASEYDPANLDVYDRIARTLAPDSGWDGLRIQALSHLCLHRRDDWRLGLELGLANCRAYRVMQGLEELEAARAAAARQGREDRFSRALAARDQSGRIRALLEGAPAAT
jgi:hypothetical protein